MQARPTPESSSPRVSSTLLNDFFASFVVFLVAVPLALGIAFASGAPIVSGLIACAVGGIVAGLLGGAPLQVTGPAAGLTVIVYGLVQKYGWPVTCLITLGAGAFQFAFGLLRISRICLAISPAVVHGMLAGIGLVIALSQMHVLLGGSPKSNALKNLLELPGQIRDLHGHATILGLITIGILYGWQLLPKRVQMIPGALVAVVVSALISNLSWFDVKRIELPSNLASAIALPGLPKEDWNGVIAAMLTVAMVASVESLLCAVATDKMHSGPRANLDKELVAQGVTNALSGLIGGLPVTGVIVRSSANITAGAKTRLSAILHGVWILLFLVFFSSLLTRIPLATLAGLLVYVGVRLINVQHIRELIHHKEAPVYFLTFLSVAFYNLLAGVGIGIALSVVFLLRRLATTKIIVEEKENSWHVRIDGSLTFISVPDLSAALEKIPGGAHVDVDLMVDFMDHAAFDSLHSWRMTYEKMGGRVDIDELHEDWYDSALKGMPKAAKSSLRETLQPSQG